jgi:hypothetical protein
MPRVALLDAPRGATARLIARAIVAACSVAITVLAVGVPSAAAASTHVPGCPPDCGSVAAGDPLLVPYITANPGVGWLALPSAEVQSYVDALKVNLRTRTGPRVGVNAVAGRWVWVTGRYDLLIALVSSGSLSELHLGSPARNAGDLCAASRGEPRSELVPIPGIPGSVSGLCALPSRSSAQGATVIAFNRGNVATLIEITSKSSTPIDPRTADLVAQAQYQTLPAGGVLVSNGFDVELVIFWLCLLTAIAIGVVACARRRRNGRGLRDAVFEAFGRRKIALGVSLLAVVGAMAFSMVDSSLLHGSGQWFESSYNDFWRNWADSAYLTFSGGYGHLYVLDRTLETAPAIQVLMAPIARLAFGLSFPDPNTVLYPQAYWVAGPLLFALMAIPICAGDRWLECMGVTDGRRRLAVLGTMAVTLPPIVLDGHAEDLVALGAMLYGLVAAQENRSRAAGYWIGAAIAFQLFAVLAIPITLVLLKRRGWLGAIVPMVLIPLAFLIVPLIGDFSATVHQLVHQTVYDDLGYISPTWNLDPGVGAFVRGLIVLAAVPAALVLRRSLPASPETTANMVIWTVAVLFSLRVFEPELVPYFLAPALALLPLSAARGSWWRLGAACLVAVWLNWWVHVAVNARWSLWLVLIGQLAVLCWLGWPRDHDPQLEVAHRRPRAKQPVLVR